MWYALRLSEEPLKDTAPTNALVSTASMPTTAMWLALGASGVLALGIAWQKLCNAPPAWMKELDILGQPRKRRLPGTAIVCGGSIAGATTARILADHFERVVLVDPEIEDGKPKTRIMQYNALHAFLSLFVLAARRLWPEFDNEFEAAGGLIVPADGQLHYSGVYLPSPWHAYPQRRLPDTLVMRRGNAQKALQRLVMKHPTAANISLLPGTVRGFNADSAMTSIRSFTVRKLDGTITALNDVALVADCTGSAQAGYKWLKSAGFSLPDGLRRSYAGNLNYDTLCFTVPPELEATLPEREATGPYFYGNLQHLEYGSAIVSLAKTDNNTMQLLLGNIGDREGDLPRVASDVVPFLERIQGHECIPPWVIETVSILCEHGNPTFDNIKIPTLSNIEYQAVPKGGLPSNFVAVGDSNLKLNPSHGQGFAKIALNGLALNSLLHTVDVNAAYTQGLWNSTRLHDYGNSGCEAMPGETKDTGRFDRWFELKLLTAASQDDEAGAALWNFRQLLATDKAFMAPRFLWKILWTPSRFSS
ncbi:hypothetical protein C8R43DRAFT_655911 [Mycena crocata]|nr:hypothetical protein C8R43DRAFT_655911 [Mycena crocata]